MKAMSFYYFLLISIISVSIVSAQTYSTGSGTVDSGVVLNTNSFSKFLTNSGNTERVIPNKLEPNQSPMILHNVSTPPIGSNYIKDTGAPMNILGGSGSNPFMYKDFAGISMGNSIPPDPNIAVGPNNVIATVNSTFKIWDKNGNVLKVISADGFLAPLNHPGAFDPQILYDHYDNRWIMAWDYENSNNQTAYHMIAISDDSNPLGVWNAWALPANKDGNTNSFTWGDYEHVGYDQNAVYITSNQIPFSGNIAYAKIRIIPKSDLYASTPGVVHYTDFWKISGASPYMFGIQPTVTYGNTTDYYLIHSPNGGNALVLYKITNPLNSPTLTGTNIPVTYFYNAPNANQLGGGNPLIESGGSRFYERCIVKGDSLWATHAIANPNGYNYSAVSYYKINVTTSSTIQDITFGSVGHWYLYPALAVDQNGNVGITYSRSGDDEYIGAYFAGLESGNPNGFSGSRVIREGKGNYVVTFGSNRNRWGDYLGAALDPYDQNSIWFFTEYASAANTWNTHVSAIRFKPFSGMFIMPKSNSINFGDLEINHVDTISTLISNYGDTPINITSIADSSGPFHFISGISLPYNLNSLDTLILTFTFKPTTADSFDIMYPISLNDTSYHGCEIIGHSFRIDQALDNLIYGATGSFNNMQLIQIDKNSGTGQNIGSMYNNLQSISVDPKTKIIYGSLSSSQKTDIYRVNASAGDAYILFSIDIPSIKSIAFDTTGTLYGATNKGDIISIDLNSETYSFLDSTVSNLSGIAFNPVTNQLWASAFAITGSSIDQIFKIDLQTGDTTNIGKTGTGKVTNDLVFDEHGDLYGVVGTISQFNDLYSIDTSTAVGTLVGSTGIKNITSIAYLPNIATGVPYGKTETIPNSFSLSQNYPNPFNPSTIIEYNLPVNSNVKVNIYNLLGELVNVLINKNETAGVHRIVWNSRSNSGNTVSSGIYFYELKAQGVNGKSFTQVRKMILLK